MMRLFFRFMNPAMKLASKKRRCVRRECASAAEGSAHARQKGVRKRGRRECASAAEGSAHARQKEQWKMRGSLGGRKGGKKD